MVTPAFDEDMPDHQRADWMQRVGSTFEDCQGSQVRGHGVAHHGPPHGFGPMHATRGQSQPGGIVLQKRADGHFGTRGHGCKHRRQGAVIPQPRNDTERIFPLHDGLGHHLEACEVDTVGLVDGEYPRLFDSGARQP